MCSNSASTEEWSPLTWRQRAGADVTMWSKNVSFTNGELHLSGISATKLAQDFGTPTFFIDEDDFRTRATGWNNALRDEFG